MVKLFSTSVEIPHTLSEMQTSILFKLALARCTNTAILMYLVLSFDQMLLPSTMAAVMTILISDAIIAPALQVRPQPSLSRYTHASKFQTNQTDSITHRCPQQVLNLPQRLMQRFLAPRAQTQSAMNAHFQGLPWHLAERYTELSKVGLV